MNARGKGWAHPKGGSEKCRDLFRATQQVRAEEGLESGVTSQACAYPWLHLHHHQVVSGGESYMCKWVCVWPDLSLIYICIYSATHPDPQKQSNYLVISARSLFLREFSGYCECGLVL